MNSAIKKLVVLFLCSILIGPGVLAADNPATATPGVQVRAADSAPAAGNLSTEAKEDYQQRISATKTGAGFLYVAGAAGVVGGLIITVNGINQRNNAQFKQKGNILTNEDDINAGNDKVVQGSLIELGGALLVVGGILMSQHARHLKEDAENKGYSVSFTPTTHGAGGMLAYQRRF
jgi:hypothetical protein